MIGRTISHYKILEKLGEGGMGEVYLAEDTKLERKVALKFLPPKLTVDPEARERFRREAKAAAALNHPGIVTIYEINEFEGQTYIAMEYVEGEALNQKIKAHCGAPLEFAEAIDIARQIAGGLNAAHRAGIVHRDVKPQNILIGRTGHVKILDFGLAKLRGVSQITREASTLGTVSYMSPEQVRGEDVDQRTDIWSFGVVLYEMLTGRRPFRGEYEQTVMYAIANDEPEPVANVRPDLPKGLVGIVARSLAKRPDERYQSIDALIDDLAALPVSQTGRMTRPAAAQRFNRAMKFYVPAIAVAIVIVGFLVVRGLLPEKGEAINSIAVLPFQNISADPDQEYFSDGMTEALIAELSKIEALRVISRTSVMRYKSTEKLVPEIARELGVEAIVEGSVLRAGHDVRITAQLIAAHPEKHLWAEDFTRTLENVLLLQSEVARAIAREIRVTVTPGEQERLARARVVNPEAHEAYLKGKYFVVKFTPSDVHKSMQYFQQAIDIDSTYALAYAGMAEAYDVLVSIGVQPPREVWPKVKTYTEKALALDPTLAQGILLIADVKFAYEWDLEGAEEYYKRAIELDPNLAMAHFFYGFYLTSRGLFKEGIPEMKRALRLDPLSPTIIASVGFGYEVAGQYDSAFAYFDRAAEIDSTNAFVYWRKPYIYLRQGKYAEAIEEAEKGVARGIPSCLEHLIIAYALSGQMDKARESLTKLFEWIGDGYESPLYIAEIYCALGDPEKALEYFEKGYQERDVHMIMSALAPPWCDFLKSDPRYRDIMKRVGVEK